MKKMLLKAILVILAIGISLSSFLNVKYFNKNQILLQQISKNNELQWFVLNEMAVMLENNCIMENYKNTSKFQLYVNNICHNFNVTPEKLSKEVKNLLTNIYDQAYLDICIKNDSIADIEKLKNGFEQLNSEIISISAEAIEYEKTVELSIKNVMYDELMGKVVNCFDRYNSMLFK